MTASRVPWWQSGAMLASVGFTIFLAVVGGGVLVGRSLQRLDDLTTLVTDTRSQVNQGNAQLQQLAQGLAQVEGALGVRQPEHAAMVGP